MEIREDELRALASNLVSFESYPGEEAAVQAWLWERLGTLGFERYRWEPDPAVLKAHPSFPPIETLDLADRPSIAGVLEFGDPDAGPTIVLNGHADVVPVEASAWSADPFDPAWRDGQLYGRGSADMKGGLAACVIAALAVESVADDRGLNGRVVVESVAGEEEGGIGAATAAAANPYPFERDAAIVAEPTDFALVVAAEGSLMTRLEVTGKSAHAARAWEGESVLPHFEAIRRAFESLERERAEQVTHPLFTAYDSPWPVTFGRVEAGEWASSVPASLTAEIRIGVAPHETVADVEAAYRQRLETVCAERPWLADHPPTLERFSVQFEGSEVDPDEPIASCVEAAAVAHGTTDPSYEGFTGGTDARHYLDAGIPTVVFGPGSVDLAHAPDEHIEWDALRRGCQMLATATTTALEAY